MTLSDTQNDSRRAEICVVRRNLQPGNPQNPAIKQNVYENIGCDETNPTSFKEMQRNDETLKQCFSEAKSKDSDFLVDENGVLYHNGYVGGIWIKQLVVPLCKRDKVISCAHNSIYAAHFSAKKTMQRILSYFYWPKIRKHVDIHLRECEPCQKNVRKTKFDRVPLKPIERGPCAMHSVVIDLIGPINPSSSGFSYILTHICLTTKYADAVPLKSLSANAACDALLQIWEIWVATSHLYGRWLKLHSRVDKNSTSTFGNFYTNWYPKFSSSPRGSGEI